MEQDVLIYIDDKEKFDASVAANSFAHKDVKNRAYINTLGAELAMKYLISENIDVSSIKNIHDIKKILEETDIADIMLSNIHIDVRVVFDENIIFVPKSHFEYDITPDIYLVFTLSQDRSFVKFSGFFEPKLINKNNANDKYYFIEKEKLSPAHDLINYINSHRGNTDKELSDNDFEDDERFIVSLYDNDISQADKKQLLKQLTKSAQLRDKFIEYENFETLSYKAMNDSMIEKKEVTSAQISDELNDNMSLLDEFPAETAKDTSNEDVLNTESITAADSDNDLTLGSGDELLNIDNNNTENVPDEFSQLDAAFSLAQNLIDTPLEGLAEFDENIGEATVSDNSNDALPTDEDVISNDIEPLETSGDISPILEDTVSSDEMPSPEMSETTDVPSEVEDTLSLDEIEPLQAEEPVNDMFAADDMLSFDEITPLETSGDISSVVEDTVSLDEMPSLEMSETTDVPSEVEDTLSLDEIEPLQAEEPVNDMFAADDMLPFDEITPLETSEDISSASEDTVSSDEMPSEMAETTDVPPVAEDTLSLDEIEPLDDISTNKTNESTFDEFADVENTASENIVETFEDTAVGTENISDDIAELPDIIEADEKDFSTDNSANMTVENSEEIIEETVETDGSSFGKNLLDNLTAEYDEILQTEDYTHPDEGISSNDILAQIDDVLSSSTTDNSDISDNQTLTVDDMLEEDDSNDLNVLYNKEEPVAEQPEILEEEVPVVVPGAALYNKSSTNKKPVLTAGALIAVMAIAAAFIFLKPKNDNNADIEPLPSGNQAPQEVQDDILAANTPQVPTNKVIPADKTVVKELKNNPPKPVKSESYLQVNKLVWDVPDALSYSGKMQNYLRTAGKSIKLSLSADLLLATEYAYTNQVKVGLTLSKNGSVQNARILSSSGSSQIDNIVLQSVKDTLNVVKPPADEVKTPEFNLNLIIYF